MEQGRHRTGTRVQGGKNTEWRTVFITMSKQLTHSRATCTQPRNTWLVGQQRSVLSRLDWEHHQLLELVVEVLGVLLLEEPVIPTRDEAVHRRRYHHLHGLVGCPRFSHMGGAAERELLTQATSNPIKQQRPARLPARTCSTCRSPA
jgi:hypothetical protein